MSIEPEEQIISNLEHKCLSDEVSRYYDPNCLFALEYEISVDSTKLENPEEQEEYLRKIFDTIYNDANELGGLDNLTLQVDDRYINEMRDVAKELEGKANKHKRMRNLTEAPALNQTLIYGGAILGGVSALFASYVGFPEYGMIPEWPGFAKLATDAAEYMNHNEYLAPITGFVQGTISIGGTLISGAAGAGGGALIGNAAGDPYNRWKTPLAKQQGKYHTIHNALVNAETFKPE